MRALDDNFHSRPLILKIMFRSWDYRFPRTIAGIRYVSGAWLLFLGALLLTYGFYWGAALIVAALANVAVGTLLLSVAIPHPQPQSGIPHPQSAIPTM
jgi:hypothetical protein